MFPKAACEGFLLLRAAQYSIVLVYNLFNHFPFEGHLGCFSSLIIAKGAGMTLLFFRLSPWFEKAGLIVCPRKKNKRNYVGSLFLKQKLHS